jgi:hypothetical protein
MNHDTFKSWLDAYGRAWEARDPHAATDLFTEDATYQETPFAEPMHGRSAIFQYWSHVPHTQDRIKFGFEILAVTESIGVARWWVSFVRVPSQTQVKLDGIFVVALDAENRCPEFREWWHKQETNPD